MLRSTRRMIRNSMARAQGAMLGRPMHVLQGFTSDNVMNTMRNIFELPSVDNEDRTSQTGDGLFLFHSYYSDPDGPDIV